MICRATRLFITATIFLFVFTAANAQPELDISFNGTGTATSSVSGNNDLSFGSVVQADNKIVMAGLATDSIGTNRSHFALLRYKTDGSLDTTYGDGGKVITIFDPNGIVEHIRAMAIQPDDKVLVAGFTNFMPPGPGAFAIARYNTDGTLDTSFGNAGKVSFSVIQHICELHSIVLAPDGKFFVGGIYFNGQSFTGIVFKLNSQGGFDTFFGSGGRVDFSFGFNLGDTSMPAALDVQPDGKLVIGGYFHANQSLIGQDITFLRYSTTGALDSSFGSSGRLRINSPTFSESISDFAILPDGKIMAVGTTVNASGNNDFLLMRLNTNGTADNTFDGDGRVLTSLNGHDSASDIYLRPNGKMAVTGNSDGKFAMVVYNADGSLDTSFSGDGKLTMNLTGVANSMAVDNLGRTIIGGYSGDKFAAARLYTLDPVPVTIYGRTLSPAGMPIIGVSVGITDQNGQTQWMVSNPFGYYQFNIMSGQTYTVSVSNKRYIFEPVTVGVNENVADLDLVGIPNEHNRTELMRIK